MKTFSHLIDFVREGSEFLIMNKVNVGFEIYTYNVVEKVNKAQVVLVVVLSLIVLIFGK